jgi:hypothetical protein
MTLRRTVVLATMAIATGLAPRAHAQNTGTFVVDRLVMAGASDDGIAVWRPDVSASARFFGQLGLGLSVNPLRASNIADNLDVQQTLKNPLTEQLVTYFNAGAEVLSRLSFQVAFPLVAYQTGNATSSAAMATPTPVMLQHVAAGDVRIEARGVVFRTDARDVKLAVNAALYLPTGDRWSFAGDGAVGAAFGLAAEYDARVIAVTLNAAYRLRPTVVLNELPVSSEVQYGLGARIPLSLRGTTIRLGAELFGAVGANPSKQHVLNSAPPGASWKSNIGDVDATPLEWMLSGRAYFTPRGGGYAGLGAGTRLTGGFAPDFRAVAMVGGSFGVGPEGGRR